MGRPAKRSKNATPRSAARPARRKSTAIDLDKLIHDRVRLGIMSALAAGDSMSFRDLRELLGTTDGNLSVHARKLEAAEYVACQKSFEGRVPRTEYRLTPTGRRALTRYLDHMESVIAAARRS